MAEQSTSQQKDRNIVNVILANVGTVITFRSANPDDEKLMLPQFTPYIKQGEISNLPLYKFYMKISAVNPEEPFSGTTTPVDIPQRNGEVKKLIELSRSRYAKLYVKEKPSKNRVIIKDSKQVNNKSLGILPEDF